MRLDDGDIEAIQRRAELANKGDTYESRWHYSYVQDVPALLAENAALRSQLATAESNLERVMMHDHATNMRENGLADEIDALNERLATAQRREAEARVVLDAVANMLDPVSAEAREISGLPSWSEGGELAAQARAWLAAGATAGEASDV